MSNDVSDLRETNMKKWWMECIGYQIYPKSFYDSNGDGIGDLKGIIAKLPYLKKLGIDLIWICPVYDSPMDDNGYDVRDFYKIDRMFGDMTDMKSLISEAHSLGMKIIMDYVLNHTSDEHKWFLESRSSKDNKYRNFYIWHDGKTVEGKRVEPTNWGSFFGGSCWQYDEKTDSYYMKIFSNKMPDLNWSNHEVREEMIRVGQWWLDLGIDGFRIDAVSHLERAEFEDIPDAEERYPLNWHKFSNLPKVHDYLREMNEKLFSPNNCLTIGEVGGEATIESAIQYAGFDSHEMAMVFNFDHNWCTNHEGIENESELKTNVVDLKKVFIKWQYGFKDRGWLPLNWLNHDHPRLMSQYGNLKYFKQSGKMLATLMYMMKGTPFVYQGEEIGMTNYPFSDVSELNDVSSINFYKHLVNEQHNDPETAIRKVALRSRDNSRTPLQWSTEENAGFTEGQPWMPVNENFNEINVNGQIDDEDSIWNFYRKLFSLRKSPEYRELIIYGDIEFIDIENPDLITYLRYDENKKLLVVNSFSEEKESYSLKNFNVKSVLLTNDEGNKISEEKIYIEPYGAVIMDVTSN